MFALAFYGLIAAIKPPITEPVPDRNQGTDALKNLAGAAELSPTVTCPVYITFVAIGVHVLRFDDDASTTFCPSAPEIPTEEV